MTASDQQPRSTPHVCPAAHGKWLATPLRRLVQKPEKILAGLIREGQKAVDLGAGPGFFTIPMAKLVGDTGCVIAVDIQDGMLDQLKSNARSAGVESRIRLHKCEPDKIGVEEPVDFVLAFYMLHEVPDYQDYLLQIHDMLKPGGRLLIVEPKFHVSAPDYRKTLGAAIATGMKLVGEPRIALSRSSLLVRE
jgi:ubiquinone/menaquinone biosynthesis C-methylase UbiE